jgi:hypothetical protein
MTTLGSIWFMASLPSLCRTNFRVFSVMSVASPGTKDSGTEFGGPVVATCVVATIADFEATSGGGFSGAGCSLPRSWSFAVSVLSGVRAGEDVLDRRLVFDAGPTPRCSPILRARSENQECSFPFFCLELICVATERLYRLCGLSLRKLDGGGRGGCKVLSDCYAIECGFRGTPLAELAITPLVGWQLPHLTM